MHALASRLAFATALVAGAVTTATAQPSETPPAPAPTPVAAPAPAPAPVAAPAPTNADWSQVSHINGQLVPVGEKNDYFYQFKRTIISADPVGWVMGFYGVSASYALDEHLALRGELDYISPPDSNTSTVEADVGVPIYFRRTYQGAFLEPGLVYRASQHEEYSSAYGGSPATTTTITQTQWGPQVLVGWHWTWESGLNIAVAAGVGRNMNYKNDPNDYSSNNEQFIPNGYMRFGYAF